MASYVPLTFYVTSPILKRAHLLFFFSSFYHLLPATATTTPHGLLFYCNTRRLYCVLSRRSNQGARSFGPLVHSSVHSLVHRSIYRSIRPCR